MYFQAVAMLCISLFRGSSGKLEGEVQRVWGERLKRQRCYAKKKQYSDDCPGYPVFGCRSIGVFTLDGCKAECNADAIDKRGRPCIGIQWKDGTKIWSASTKKTCSLLWACDKIGGHPGGSTWLVSNEPVPAPKTSAPVPAPKTSAPVPAPKTLSPVPAPKIPAPVPACAAVTNIALGKPASLSCESGFISGSEWPASKAVDGNTDGHAAGHSIAISCYKDQSTVKWWSVSLGKGTFTIKRIVVWNRTDSQATLDFIKGATMEIYNNNVLVTRRVFATASPSYPFAFDGVEGNKVKLILQSGVINLAEVQVYGYASVPGCKPVPAPKTLSPVPAPKTLSPVPAPKTLSPVPEPVCDRTHSINISKGKWAAQSCNHGSLGHAGLAIDGNTDGDWYHKSVTHTCVKAHAKAWWSVFLGYGPWTITKIVVWNRTDQAQDRIKDGKIEIFNTPNGQVIETKHKLMASRVFGATQNKYTFEFDCVPGNEVTISVPDGIINLAEVEVFGYATPSKGRRVS